MAVVSELSLQTPFVDHKGRLTSAAVAYLQGPAPGEALSLAQGVQQSVITPVTPTSLTGQTASLATTPFPLGTNPGGLYRLSFYARITTPASVSSSLTVSFSWTDGGIACSVTSSAMTGNTTASTLSGSTLIQSDASSPISFSATYASVGTAMAYEIIAVIERIG